MTEVPGLRSRVTGNCQARFWIGGGAGDRPTDHNVQMGVRWYDPALGRWTSADTIVPDSTNPQSLNRYSFVLANPLKFVDPSGNCPTQKELTYWIWKTKVNVTSAIRLAHGRQDVRQNENFVRSFARAEHELMVAASIAHQASDVTERPFGAAAIEQILLLAKPDASVGIAQLRQSEIDSYAPGLSNRDLQEPRMAVHVMNAKIVAIDQYIHQAARLNHESLSQTNRFMMIGMLQNAGSEGLMRKRADMFFEYDQNWRQILVQDPQLQETLRWFYLQLEWLLSQGWELPDGVDMDTIQETAFTDY